MGERITIRFYPTEQPKKKKSFLSLLFSRIKNRIKRILNIN